MGSKKIEIETINVKNNFTSFAMMMMTFLYTMLFTNVRQSIP